MGQNCFPLDSKAFQGECPTRIGGLGVRHEPRPRACVLICKADKDSWTLLDANEMNVPLVHEQSHRLGGALNFLPKSLNAQHAQL